MTFRLNSFALAAALAMNLSTAAAQSVPSAIDSFLKRATLFENCSIEQTEKISTVLATGLTRISTMNPELIANRIAFTGERQAKFNCEISKVSKGSDAETYMRSMGFPFSKGKLRKIALINVGKVFSTEQTFAPETALLHEFLHFMSMDNLPQSLHNDPDVVYSSAIFYFDVVFSCSVAAFPVENTLYKPGFIARMPIHTDWMAQTCAAARTHHGSATTVKVENLEFLNTKLRGSVECYLLTKGFKDRPRGKFNERPQWAKVADRCELSSM